MIKKFILSVLLCLLTSIKSTNALENQKNSFAKFDGKKIAVVVGTNFDQLAKEKLPNAEYVYLNTFTDAISALSKNKVEGVIIDKPMGINLTKIISNFSIFPEELALDDYAFAVKKGNQKLLNEINTALAQLKKDHSLYSIQEIWLGSSENLKIMPEKPKKIKGSLKVVVDGESFPFVYYRNNEIVGATLHVLYEICRKLGYGIEINVVDPSAKIASLESGKSDVAAGYLSITEERKEHVSFTDIEYNSAAVLLINTPNHFTKFDYKKTAIIKQSFLEKTIKEKLPKAEYVYFDTYSSAIEAFNKNIISSIAVDKNIASNLLKTLKNATIHPTILNEETFAFAVAKNNNLLKEEINGVLNELKKQGKIDSIQKKWIENENVILSNPYNDKNKTLRIGVSTDAYPFVYTNEKNEIVGATIELLYEIGKKLNYNIELKEIPDLARTFALENGKIDLIAGTYSITNSKNKYVSFTIPEYESSSVLIVKEDSFEKFNSKKIAVALGAIHDKFVLEKIPSADIQYYNSFIDVSSSVSQGLNYAGVLDEPVAQKIVEANSNLEIYPQYLKTDNYALGIKKGNTELNKKISKIILKYKNDGTLKTIKDIWTEEDTSIQILPKKPKAINGTITLGAPFDNPPFLYVRNGELVGFAVDLLYKIGNELGYGIEFSDVNAASLIPSLNSEKSDIIGPNLSITEERKKEIDFSEPFYSSNVVMIVKKENNFADLEGKTFCYTTGTALDKEVIKQVKNPKTIYMNSTPDCLINVLDGKALYPTDLPRGLFLINKYPNLEIYHTPLFKDDYAFIVDKTNMDLKRKIDSVIIELRKNGTMKSLQDIWLGFDESKKILPEDLKNPKNGYLTFATDPTFEPLSYVRNGEPVGYSIALLKTVLNKLDYGIKIVITDFGSLIPALKSGKVDIAGGSLSITKERMKQVLFTEPEYYGSAVILQKKGLFSNSSEKNNQTETFFENIKNSFIANFIREDRYKMVLQGIKITLIISIFTILFGMFFGMIVCAMRRSKNKIINSIAKTYIRILQGTPILVLLMIMFYIVFAKTELSPIIVAIIAFGLNSAAYCAEIFRTGIDSIDKGQKEASLALGFNNIQTFMLIYLPQATKHVIPVLKGEFVSTVKSTSIVGYIAIQDLTKVCDIIRSRTYDAFFPLIASAAIYFTLTYILTVILSFIEFKLDPKQRKRIVKGCTNND
ncbi:MAG: ABC transporter permease subunit [Alphaproteobacteria bacterium]|nr:ABC transporter permease subunit [Alphaproteobacteria bacterium]